MNNNKEGRINQIFFEKLIISSLDAPSWFIRIIARTLTKGIDAKIAAKRVSL